MSNNAAVMREALEKIGAMETPHNFQIERSDIVDACYDLTKAIKIAKAAFAAPPRNCDVGTAEEQEKRYDVFCNRYFVQDNNGGDCSRCPLSSRETWSCQLKWAQMPYEEGNDV